MAMSGDGPPAARQARRTAAMRRAATEARHLRAVQQLLGHESVATTERYLAVDDAEMRAAMLGAVGESSPLLRIAS